MNLMKKAIGAATSAAFVASLLATVVAPAALASTSVVSAGTIARGTTSATAASFTFTENSIAAFTGAGTLTVTISDSAGNPTVHFTGTGVLTAPDSLGATLAVSDNSFTVTTTAQDPNNVEQITVSGLKIKADIGAATGAIKATLTGSGGLPAGVTAGTVTATGTLQNNILVTGTSATVVVTSSCGFAVTGGSNTTVNFSDTSDPLAISAVSGTTTQTLTIAAATAAHSIGATLTQTVANCNPTALASPGTVADTVVQTATSTSVVPGEQNQAGGTTTITEQTAGYIPAGTLTFKLSPAGVLFSASPSISHTGNIVVGSTCNLSFDRTSCSVTVTTASTGVSTVTLNGVMLDVASTVAPGSLVNVTVTSSPAINVSITSQTIATVGRVIVGVAGQPTIFINYNDQSTGLITLTEQGAGFFQSGTGANNTFGLCLTTGESFTRLPYAVVTNGDLKLLNGLVGGTSVLGTYGNTNNCVYWTVYTASTVASTIEIRGSDATGAVLPTGALNGPRLSVPAGLAPGTTQASILVGFHNDVVSNDGDAFSSLVSFATRAFKSGVVVAAVSQPTIPAGTTDSLAGNLTISETLNGQFKPGQDICVTILPRTSNGARTQDTFIKTATTNDLPVITTNSASGLLTSSVATPGCPPSFNNEFFFGGIPFLPNPGSSFTFAVNQQSFGGTLGVITISNIHLVTTADAVNGPVLVDVLGDSDGGAVQFESVVSNATIGTPAAVTTVGSALGATKVGPFTVSTKVAKLGKYVTWKFSGGSALVGKTVQIWVATKSSAGTWGAFKQLTARTVDASGNAYFWWKSSSTAWISVRAGYQTSMSVATQARWR